MQNTTSYNKRLNINELNNTANLEEAIKKLELLLEEDNKSEKSA